MNLKDQLNQATNKALIAQKQKELMDTVIHNEEEKKRIKVARQQGKDIINTLEFQLFKAANDGKKSCVLSELLDWNFEEKREVVKINIGYGIAGNADLMFDKKSLPIHLKNNIFNNNMQYYYVIEHVVNHLGLGCVLKFNHDGVGESSWHELVINW